MPAMIRYLDLWATAALRNSGSPKKIAKGKGVYINVVLTKATGVRPRNFESWSSKMDDTQKAWGSRIIDTAVATPWSPSQILTEEQNVLDAVRKNPSSSIRAFAAAVGGPRNSIHRVLQREGKPLVSYRFQKAQSHTVMQISERPVHIFVGTFHVFTATVSEGKAIFGGRAAIEFSFGEKERPAQRRSN
ncbi:hypothetical protein TNCV_1532411 [Trichonephila clavipes]|nr:hypothetical protein TNCV_1532411 [Trichonephila clavipes]